MEDLSNNYYDTEDVIFTLPSSSVEQVDTEPPIINIKQKTYKIKTNESIDLISGVTASDAVDGDLTNKITTNISELDFSKQGIKKVEYTVSDSSGNIATEYTYVTVKKDSSDLIKMGQIGIIAIAIILIIFLYKYIKSLKLERRFSKYTINSSKNKSISLFDNLYIQGKDFENKLSKYLSKSNFLTRKSKRYEKYVIAFSIKDTITFMAKKIISAYVFIVFAMIIVLLQSKLLGLIGIIVSFILGYYSLDIVYFYKYLKYKKNLEQDMLDAVSIMNNAFKAGMSIIQAIDLVSREIKGPISNEFKKVGMDIKMGLDIEIAFRRFSKRVKTEEAMYLSSSLSVLNKTGGNIIKVFDSIEKNVYNRKKLELELKSLTASSKLIMYVLIIVPPLFMVVINLINKDYFEPMFNNPLGIALLFIMLIIYITYIFVVRKTLKVRGVR